MSTAASTTAKGGADMMRRGVIGVLLAAAVLASVATVPTFAFVLIVVALGSLWELERLSERKGQALIFPVAALAVATYLVLSAFGLQQKYEKIFVAGTLIATLGVGLYGARQGYLARCAFTLFGVLYIGWLSSYFLVLRNLPLVGAWYAAGAFVLIALTDIFAMLVGVGIGRTPLTPISPSKTWEGAIGGLVAASLAGASFAFLPPMGITWWQGVFVGAVTSVAAQAGDLIESALKRDASVKDAGTLLGGHGGVLDRFDSYILGGIAFYGAMYVTGHIAAVR